MKTPLATTMLAAAVLALSWGCGGDSTSGGGTDGGGTSGTSGSGGGGGSAGAAIACGDGLADCPDTHFCDFAADDCGANETPGKCRLRGTSNPEGSYYPGACGCDGVMYSYPSLAFAAGVDVGGECTPPSGTGWCGDTPCPIGTHYCEVFQPDAHPSVTCIAFASPCSDCSCADDAVGKHCHPGETCCEQDPSGLVFKKCGIRIGPGC